MTDFSNPPAYRGSSLIHVMAAIINEGELIAEYDMFIRPDSVISISLHTYSTYEHPAGRYTLPEIKTAVSDRYTDVRTKDGFSFHMACKPHEAKMKLEGKIP